MTTIVYRNGILAADSAVCDDGMTVGTLRKIIRIKQIGFMSLCGFAPANHNELIEWLSNWPVLNNTPECVKTTKVRGLFVLKDGEVFQIDGGEPYRMDAPFFAEGSGRFIALGALAMGASAEQAVAIAIHYDNCSGDPVQIVKVCNPHSYL